MATPGEARRAKPDTEGGNRTHTPRQGRPGFSLAARIRKLPVPSFDLSRDAPPAPLADESVLLFFLLVSIMAPAEAVPIRIVVWDYFPSSGKTAIGGIAGRTLKKALGHTIACGE